MNDSLFDVVSAGVIAFFLPIYQPLLFENHVCCREEDSRLKEAARLEELARSRQLQAEQTRLEAAETQRRSAEAAARRAEEQRLAATRLFEVGV